MLYRYEFFEGTSRDTVRDIELKNDLAAIEEGYRTAYEMVKDGVKTGFDKSSWSIQIFYDRNTLVGTIANSHQKRNRKS
ncbi:hypothetical protein QFZ34_001193 [Phyllobacterium ifriqiyense]|uniref:DUF6894 domain-containing protein n=1 Tax=Phyllobacterium ifriqiyense TaxID=314238 RepID=A0ABU0S5H9_9HYPH|nr:hypothetical protein [Phyllobacterium ifriqiyense]MDQ0996016.1 hypothetical protein [Phyllobacterium ifriqiyense]